MSRKVIVASAGTDDVSVHGGEHGKFNLKGVAEQCEHCAQPVIAKGTSVILDVPEGYHLELVEDESV